MAAVALSDGGADPFSYAADDLSAVHVRTHDGHDSVDTAGGMTKLLRLFGGGDRVEPGTGDDDTSTRRYSVSLGADRLRAGPRFRAEKSFCAAV